MLQGGWCVVGGEAASAIEARLGDLGRGPLRRWSVTHRGRASSYHQGGTYDDVLF